MLAHACHEFTAYICLGWSRRSDPKGKLKLKGGRLWGVLRLARLRYLTLAWRIREAAQRGKQKRQ